MNRSELRVLVVDDQADCLTATVKYLDIFGFSADGADSGAGALEQAAAHRPDVVVLDLGLPDVDGLTLLERLREGATDRPPLFIALSGRCDDHTRQRAAEAGVVEFLVKPVSPETLVTTIDRWCDERPHGGQPANHELR